ncbi:30S ribosomal protein S1 [Nevskia soli]|uniref:30S ribosomal protein S1 n=1 Tax=Nevskia soli TaxID=418856 RepID=UPI0015D76AB9|nr:30S ribosomal protein S1 [Nevskia soli]
MVNQTELERELEAPATSEESKSTADSTPSDATTSFGDLLSEFEQSHSDTPSDGAEGRAATVVGVSGDAVFLDVGLKTEGLLALDKIRDRAGEVKIKPGDKMRVSITGRDDAGYYTLSLLHVEQPKDWSGLQAALAEKRTVTGTVTGLIKGGVTVDVGVRAFMPASRSGARDVADLEKLVGQEIACKVIKVDPDDNDVVVDRRAVIEEEQSRAKEQRFTEVREGMVVKGIVRNLLDYGAFVDIGGVDGMLHVAEISYGRVAKPADVLTVGQEIEVQIIKVDPRKRRISLSMKQLQADPWTTAADRYHVGDRIKGTVSRIADFGAFVELEPGLDGLVHLSEMSWSKKVRKPSDVVNPGDVVDVVVLGVNPGDKRISLGLKQALGDPWEDAEKKYAPGVIVEAAPITSLTKFGAFVQLDEFIEGMIHVGDISAEKRVNHPSDELKVGQTVRALVLEADKARRRIRLGLKQLVPTAADEYIAEHKEGETVTGRVTDVARNRATVELGEGVQGVCVIAERAEPKPVQKAAAPTAAPQPAVDLTAFTSMLTSKWKGGGGGSSAPSTPASLLAAPPPAPETDSKSGALKTGQVRSFQIKKIDADKKRIDLELA